MFIEPVNALNRWWPCTCLKCVSGLGWLERNLNFLRCIHVFDLVLKFGSDIKEGNWLQLLLHFIVSIGLVDSGIGMSFLSSVSDFRCKFSVLNFDGIVCNWISKVIWPWMDWFSGFRSKTVFCVDFIPSRTEIGSICWIVIFLMTDFFDV